MFTNFLTRKHILLILLLVFGTLSVILLLQLISTSYSNHHLKGKFKTLKIEYEGLEDSLKDSLKYSEKLYEEVMNLTISNQLCKDEIFKKSFLLKNCKYNCLNEK